MNTMQYQSCLSCMSWMEKSDLLKYGVVNGIISQPLMGSSEAMLNASQQEVITHMTSDWLQTHPIRKAKNGRFYTYYYKEEGGQKKRIQINKATEEEVVAELALQMSEIKKPKHKKKKEEFVPTLENMFPGYIRSKELDSPSNNNAASIRVDWRRYYQDDPIIKRPMADISVQEWHEWKITKIKTLHLSKQRKNVMNSLANGVYDYAIRCGYLTINTSRLGGKGISPVLTDVNEIPHPVETQVFKAHEIPIAIDWLLSGNHGFRDNECVLLALALDFFLGLRVGELSALKVSDFSKQGVLTIQRQEIDNYNESSEHSHGVIVVPYTKKHRNRTVTLPSQTIPVLKRIFEFREQYGITNEFMFCNKRNERIRRDVYHVAMKSLCKAIGTTPKSIHSVRKTVISNVAMTDLNLAQNMAGHKSKQTTLDHYVFNLYDPEHDRKTLDNIFDPVCPSFIKFISSGPHFEEDSTTNQQVADLQQ